MLTIYNEVNDSLNNLSSEKLELFLKHFLKEHGFSSVAIIARNSGKEITAIAFIEIGIISYQFFIKFVVGNTIISATMLNKLRSEANAKTNKGLIITTSTFTREAKSAKRKKGEIPIDLIDGSQLTKRVKELNLSV